MSTGVNYVGWDQKHERAGSGQFLKLKAGKTYKIRLVGSPIQYHQHWAPTSPITCRSPGKDKETGKIIDPLMLQNFTPKERYCIWVLDRDDGNTLKMMDFPPILYDQFKEWAEAANEQPGGVKGCDWSIKVEIPAGGDVRRTKYKATSLPNSTPFTEEELKAMKEGKLKEKLNEARKPNTPDEIRKMLAEKGVTAGPPGQEAGTPSATVSTPAPTPVVSSEKPKGKAEDFDF